jgi:hypothetical protein
MQATRFAVKFDRESTPIPQSYSTPKLLLDLSDSRHIDRELRRELQFYFRQRKPLPAVAAKEG